MIRTAPRPQSAAGPLAPPTADRARSVSPAALSMVPNGRPNGHAHGHDTPEGNRPRSQPDASRAASAAPSLSQGLQFDFDGLPSEAGAAEPPEEGSPQGEGRKRERDREEEEDGEDDRWQ